MPLHAESVNATLLGSAGAEQNLTAACHGILATELAPSPSPWHAVLAGELDAVKALARDWTEHLAGLLQRDLFREVARCGQLLLDTQPQVAASAADAPTNADAARRQFSAALAPLEARVKELADRTSRYNTALHDWGVRLDQQQQRMQATIGKIQQQENTLQDQIAAINQTIQSLQARIAEDQKAIADAKRSRTSGIVETIFGFLLAPVTLGGSLALAGIGVSSIAEAQGKISSMEGAIREAGRQIIGFQQNMTQDQVQIATLKGLTMSAALAIDAVNRAVTLIDQVRTQWEQFALELSNVIGKLDNSATADMILLQEVWFDAACKEWSLIVALASSITEVPVSQRPVTISKADVPVVRLVPVSSVPPVPADLLPVFPSGPDSFKNALACPVLLWEAHAYWAFSFRDNRVALAIVAYDSTNKQAGRWEKPGARYLWRMTVSGETLVLDGQAGASISVALKELHVP